MSPQDHGLPSLELVYGVLLAGVRLKRRHHRHHEIHLHSKKVTKLVHKTWSLQWLRTVPLCFPSLGLISFRVFTDGMLDRLESFNFSTASPNASDFFGLFKL